MEMGVRRAQKAVLNRGRPAAEFLAWEPAHDLAADTDEFIFTRNLVSAMSAVPCQACQRSPHQGPPAYVAQVVLEIQGGGVNPTLLTCRASFGSLSTRRTSAW